MAVSYSVLYVVLQVYRDCSVISDEGLKNPKGHMSSGVHFVCIACTYL